jgi:hypothetical protein
MTFDGYNQSSNHWGINNPFNYNGVCDRNFQMPRKALVVKEYKYHFSHFIQMKYIENKMACESKRIASRGS